MSFSGLRDFVGTVAVSFDIVLVWVCFGIIVRWFWEGIEDMLGQE